MEISLDNGLIARHLAAGLARAGIATG